MRVRKGVVLEDRDLRDWIEVMNKGGSPTTTYNSFGPPESATKWFIHTGYIASPDDLLTHELGDRVYRALVNEVKHGKLVIHLEVPLRGNAHLSPAPPP